MQTMSTEATNLIMIDLQNDHDLSEIPTIDQFQDWVGQALLREFTELEQTIRIVDEAESQQLNSQYRAKDNPTNVLSFPAEDSEYLDYDNLGDLVICAPVVQREAGEQGKPVLAHWAHMVVHGMLHLQGYDHETAAEAEEMERLEVEILGELGFGDPYQ